MLEKILGDIEKLVKLIDTDYVFFEATNHTIEYTLPFNEFATCVMHFGQTKELPTGLSEFTYILEVNEEMKLNINFKLK